MKEILSNPDSITGRYLCHSPETITTHKRKKYNLKHALEIKGACANNLKTISVKIPLKVFCCITGVSGSGKSTLVHDVLYRALTKALHGGHTLPGKHEKITGIRHIDKVIEIDQSPIGRTPRSNPATYTKVFDPIRALFAQTQSAKIRGYTAARYSFNISGGRCEACKGQGTKKMEMHFLPDTYVICDECNGKRYTTATLETMYKGKNISEVLEMRIEDAHFFLPLFPG